MRQDNSTPGSLPREIVERDRNRHASRSFKPRFAPIDDAPPWHGVDGRKRTAIARANVKLALPKLPEENP